jgi:hypothetical protein
MHRRATHPFNQTRISPRPIRGGNEIEKKCSVRGRFTSTSTGTYVFAQPPSRRLVRATKPWRSTTKNTADEKESVKSGYIYMRYHYMKECGPTVTNLKRLLPACSGAEDPMSLSFVVLVVLASTVAKFESLG